MTTFARLLSFRHSCEHVSKDYFLHRFGDKYSLASFFAMCERKYFVIVSLTIIFCKEKLLVYKRLLKSCNNNYKHH